MSNRLEVFFVDGLVVDGTPNNNRASRIERERERERSIVNAEAILPKKRHTYASTQRVYECDTTHLKSDSTENSNMNAVLRQQKAQ